MKPRDKLILAGIIVSLVLTFLLTRLYRPERVRPGSPEYEAYIQRAVDECIQSPARNDLNATLPPAELATACRNSVLQADRFNPAERPLKH
jgi:hypothetical protein